jgi:hypothetical protein
MNYQAAETMFAQIESSAHRDSVRELIACAVRYARIRTDWHLLSPEARMEQDSARTSAHNAFIDTCNILSRAMAKSGEPTEWRRLLDQDRKVIGDFACYIHCIRGIDAR